MQITKAELERKYWSMTNRELCAELNITPVTLMVYIDRAGIKRKGKGGRIDGPRLVLVD